MPVSAALLAAAHDSVAGSSATTASINPGANRLVLVWVFNRRNVDGTAATPTLSGGGMTTWTQVTTGLETVGGSGNNVWRATLFRALQASPGSGTLTIDFGGESQDWIHWQIAHYDGVDTGGTNGSNAVVQAVYAEQETASSATMTVTLAAFAKAYNATTGAVVFNADSAINPGTGFTELGETTSSGTGCTESEFRASADTTVDFTHTGGAASGAAIAVEVRAAPLTGIELVGDYKVAEAATGTTLTFDKDNAAVTGIVEGDVVMVQVCFRDTSGSISITTDGGQSWTEVHDAASASEPLNGLYTCVFNGTWTADPVWTKTGSALPRSIWVWVLRGVDTSDIFDVDPVWATESQAAFDIADFNTNTDGAWAFGMAGAADDNTWTVDNSFVAPSGSGNIYVLTGAGADMSLVACRKLIPTAGAVGAFTMTQSAGDQGYKVYGALKPAAFGQSAAVAMVTETNVVQAITKQKSKVVGQVVGTHVAQPIAEQKSRLIPILVESEIAQLIAKQKSKVVPQVAESDIAQALIRQTIEPVVQAIETDISQAIVEQKSRTVAQAIESDVSQAMVRKKTKALVQVTSGEIAQPVSERKAEPVSQAVENDLAQTISSTVAHVVNRAVESDLAQTITRRKLKSMGQATETDIANTLTERKARLVGQSLETNLAQAIARRKADSIGMVTETDLALAIVRAKKRLLGIPIEQDLALPILTSQAGILGRVTENDISQPIVRRKSLLLQSATENDLAQALSRRHSRELGMAIESDVAQPIGRVRVRLIGLVTEQNIALPFGSMKSVLIGQAVETDIALALLNVLLRGPIEALFFWANPMAALTETSPMQVFIAVPEIEIETAELLVVFAEASPQAIITGRDSVPKALSREEVEMSLLRMTRGETAEWDVVVRHPQTKQPIDLSGKALRFMAKHEYEDDNAAAIIDVSTPTDIQITDPLGGLAHIKVPSDATADLENERTRLVYEFEIKQGSNINKSDNGYLVVNPQVVLP